MNCPSCATELKMSERQGVEIDYCPQCRGVWLDRGELDKIIERSSAISGRSDIEEDEGYAPFGWRKDKRDRDERYDDRHRHGDDYEHKRRKRGSFLGDLFDFD
ncbi:MAG TPA: zf-TFIIB domain-containing protein [Blastocatellia bacterium]|nr:zf-TFIIB domain-containing protein [Blastocatellia bacterium]